MAGGKDARTGMQTVKGENDKTGKRTPKRRLPAVGYESILEQGAKEPLGVAEDGKGGFSGRVLQKRRT